MTPFWCSSSTWVFSELPKVIECQESLNKLKQINNLFTGEFDCILFPGQGPAKVIDAEMGVFMQPKPITELDRLSYVVRQITDICVVPKNFMKFVPAGHTVLNEAFRGISKEESFKLENWKFTRKPRNPEIKGMIERGEAIYCSDSQDTVADDFPKNSWSLQTDATGTVTTLKSHLWPGFYAYHRCNTNIAGFFYMGDGIRNSNLPFMV